MSTDLQESGGRSTTDTDLGAPDLNKAERALIELVEACCLASGESSRRTSYAAYPTRDKPYSVDSKDLEAWRVFDESLAGILRCESRSAVSTALSELRHGAGLSGFRLSRRGERSDSADRMRRYAELSSLLDEWAVDPSDFDKSVAPLIVEALRETAPRHFPE